MIKSFCLFLAINAFFYAPLSDVSVLQLTESLPIHEENNPEVLGPLRLKNPRFTQLSGYNAAAIKAADFNGDGVKDSATILPDDDKLAIQLGDGEGNLSAPLYFTTGDNPVDLDIADFNGDGETDITVALNIPNQLSVFLGDGTGNFIAQAPFAAGGTPQKILTGKFNADDDWDIAVANSNNITIFFGNGNASFAPASPVSVPPSARSFLQADFNRDGNQDLIIFYFSGNGWGTKVFQGNGNGGFIQTLDIPNLEARGIDTGDFNSDGFTDLAINDYRQNSIRLYPGDGNGGFGTVIVSTVGYQWDIYTTDFDRDGKLDLISPGGNILKGNGAGGFTTIFRGSVNAVERPAVDDFNSDGWPDILSIVGVANPDDSVVITMNDGTGLPYCGREILTGSTRVYSMGTADFNMDGKQDLVAANFGDGTLKLAFQNAAGDLVPPPVSSLVVGPTGIPNNGPLSVAVSDFNEDGKPDIAAPGFFFGLVAVFLNDGSGTFTKNTFNQVSNSIPRFLRIGDFNNDGHKDMITMNSASRNFNIYMGDGSGNFTVSTGATLTSQSGPNNATIGDFNGDGKQDIVASRFFENNLLLLTGNGDGTFATSPTQIPMPVNVVDIISPDLNNDTKPDLVAITGEFPSTLQISLNNGNGTFGNPVSTPLNVPVQGNILYRDLDLDGLNDISLGNLSNGSLLFFKGNGSGGFAFTSTTWLGPQPFALVSSDFNNDGKPDVATGANLSGNIKLYLNDTVTTPGLSVDDDIIISEDSGGTFTVSLSEPSLNEVRVNYETTSRTAERVADFSVSTGQLIYPPGTVSRTVNVQTAADNLDENDETFSLTLSAPLNAVITNGTGVATILDNDTQPNLEIQPTVSGAEGSGGTSQFTFPLALSAPSGKKIKVQYATANGTAVSPSDYLQTSGTLYFLPGTTQKPIKISIEPDTLVEPDETFTLNLIAPVNVALSNSQSAATIVNDDFGGNIQFALSSVNTAENSGSATITVTRLNGAASGITVQYATSNGTATAGQDYTSTSGTLSFGANENSKSFSIPITNDSVNEINAETVNISLSNAAGGATLGTPIAAVLNILDDDRTVAADFDGDRKSDLSVFRPAIGAWFFQRSSNNSVAGFNFGLPTDKITPADYTGDAKTDIAVYRPSTGEWYILRSEDSTIFGMAFGLSTDIPAPGDFDGDGKVDITVFRPSNGTWFSSLSSGGTLIFPFGQNGDVPVVGDYDADGRSDIAIFRSNPTNNWGEWWIQRSTAGIFVTVFGTDTDIPVVADYTGDGTTDVAFRRPSDGWWFVLQMEDFNYFAGPFGTGTDLPVPGDYDGDGKADFGVFRPTDAAWFVQKSTGGFLIQQFGSPGDKPVPAAYVPPSGARSSIPEIRKHNK